MDSGYKPEGKILWDSWFIKKGGDYHVFYLQTKATENPQDRHNSNVSIGHAASKNLVEWRELPYALEVGKPGSWDDLALWTGSVIKKGKTYFMFYTGRCRKAFWIQKIGLANSKDLISWEKYEGNPLLEAKKYYYIDNRKNRLGKVGAWRDPFVFWDEKSDNYYMLVSAREKNAGRQYNGCVAICSSKNLLDWKILPPIFSPKVFDEIETTQMIVKDGVYYLFFSTQKENLKPDYAEKNGLLGGLYCFYSNDLFGKYTPVNKNGVVLANEEKMYDIRLIHAEKNLYHAIGWLNKTKNKTFEGSLSQPFKIKIEKDEVGPI
ncbi:MAG: hypothetical protein GF334_00575 [Candidatus Altiarchaeales archaeon]|nr:hypothetical protein [Candidatus Altiarchaeales archaeon]